MKYPVYRGILISGVSIKSGSSVVVVLVIDRSREVCMQENHTCPPLRTTQFAQLLVLGLSYKPGKCLNKIAIIIDAHVSVTQLHARGLVQ